LSGTNRIPDPSIESRGGEIVKLQGMFSGFFILSLCMLAIPVSAFPSDYVVEPGYGSGGIPVPDLNPITFWDLSPREMAVVAMLIVFPAFVVPVELLFAFKLIFYLGFKRIARKNILDSSSRNLVYTGILADPGIRIAELIGKTGLSRGTVSYHLAMLEVTGKITVLRTHGDISYFENSGKYTPAEQRFLKHVRCETGRRILSTLFFFLYATRTELETVLTLSGPTVTWHMKRLADDGVIVLAKDGRFSSYMLPELTRVYVRKYLDNSPAYSLLCPHVSRPGPVLLQ